MMVLRYPTTTAGPDPLLISPMRFAALVEKGPSVISYLVHALVAPHGKLFNLSDATRSLVRVAIQRPKDKLPPRRRSREEEEEE